MTRRESFDVSGPAQVEVDNPSGSVEVHVGPDARVAVTIDGPAVDEWEVVQVGASVSIRRNRERGWRSRSTRLYVEAPAGSDLDISTASADVVTVGDFGAARLRTASGDVRVDTLQRLDANSASGSLRAKTIASDVTCNAVSGDVELGTVGGRLHSSTASGNIRASDVGGDVELGTASGDVAIGRCGGSDISAKCVSGSVSIGLPAGIRVEPDISTLSGRTKLPEPSSVPPTDAPRRSVRLKLRTVSGDIKIVRVDDVIG
jgi:DUF4097 and DUF4098 domain-containing protein YvlB